MTIYIITSTMTIPDLHVYKARLKLEGIKLEVREDNERALLLSHVAVIRKKNNGSSGCEVYTSY